MDLNVFGKYQYLMRNETAYNELLAWKRRPLAADVRRFQRVIDMTAYKYTALCRICHKLLERRDVGALESR